MPLQSIPLAPSLTLTLLLITGGCASTWSVVDLDGDGFSPADGDCWDDPAQVPQVATGAQALVASQIFPGAQETWYDGIDQDCDQRDDFDADRDGWAPAVAGWAPTLGVTTESDRLPEGDCWDSDDADERPDDFRPLNNLPALTPGQVHPGVEDAPYDGVDADCAGFDADGNGVDDDFDVDADGFAAEGYRDRQEVYGTDCDDDNELVHPEVDEICDDIDNDCDGLVDGDDPSVNLDDVPSWLPDDDSDGYGDGAEEPIELCDAPPGYVSAELELDCDDDNGDINPGAQEICDDAEVDEDCDGLADDLDDSVLADSQVQTWPDGDVDGYGDATADPTLWCDPPDGVVTNDLDCDDLEPLVNPGAQEVCDEADTDEDCDGDVDDDDLDVDSSTMSTFYGDADGDGYGDPTRPGDFCDAPAIYVVDDTDCDDTDAAINPAATEICDSGNVDEDCNGLADDDDSGATGGTTVYADSDGDGYGDPAVSDSLCDPDSSWVSNDEDCDDSTEDISPDATEVCSDGIDNDCDSATTCAMASGSLSDASLSLGGTSTSGWAGWSVGGLGDTDGDGYDDFLVGSKGAGKAWLVMGPTTASLPDYGSTASASASLSDAATLVITGTVADGFANTLGRVGDIDGDGYDDLVVSEPNATVAADDEGVVYLFFGPLGSSDLTVDDADLSVLGGEGDGVFGYAVSGDLDLDGDGMAEVLVGAPQGNGSTSGGGPGVVYLFEGNELTLATGSLDAADAAILTLSTAGLTDSMGWSVDGVDSDGDGLDELLVGLPTWTDGTSATGAVVLIDDSESGTVTLGDAGQSLFVGTGASDRAGWAVAGAGDLDGDGYEDLAMAADKASSSAGKSSAGRVYVFMGPATGLGQVNLSSADAILEGGSADRAGFSLSRAGDLDGDGNGELILGSYGDDSAASDAGAAYVFYGPLTGTVATSAAALAFTGTAASDRAGSSVAGDLDVNGDGYGDLMVGSRYAETGATTDAGSAYLLLGLGE